MNIRELIGQMTLEEKASLCSGWNAWQTKPVERLGIPSLRVSDGPHGLRKQKEGADNLGIMESIRAVCFPAGCALASSFDKALLQEVGAALGEECQAEDVDILLGPAVNIKRSPLCGRNFEYYSEDPLVASTMAAGYIQGLQSQGVGACLKHFFANNQETRRFSSSSELDQRTEREIYLAAFEGAVKEGKPWTVMCAYNRIHGVYAAENRPYLTGVLREEWGFDGFVMSDWGATNDRVPDLQAGMELEMPPLGNGTDEEIVAAVKEGRLSQQVLDQAVERLLTIAFRAQQGKKPGQAFHYEADHQLAKKAAEESVVLLKNQGMLPLKSGETVLVVGEFAAAPRYQGGGSSHINTTTVDAPWDFLANAPELKGSVTYAKGFSSKGGATAEDLEEAVRLAKTVDKVLVFAGLPESFESEGYDRTHMKLPEEQNQLMEALLREKCQVAVILQNGAPVEMPWVQGVDAVVEAYLGGEAVGSALAEILLGHVNPCGHLAETFPLRLEDTPAYLNYFGEGDRVTYTEGVFVGYRYYDTKCMDVLFPFGHGLSYTTFAYSNLRLDREAFQEGETLTVSVDVTNTGALAGKELVQLYVCPPKSSLVIRPVHELKGFEKVWLAPGNTKTVSLRLDSRAFAFFRQDMGDWFVESGAYGIEIAQSSRNIVLTASVKVTGNHTSLQEVTLYTPLGDVLALPGSVEVLLANGVSLDKQECTVDNENEEQILQAHYQYMPLRSRMIGLGPQQCQAVLEQLRGLIH